MDFLVTGRRRCEMDDDMPMSDFLDNDVFSSSNDMSHNDYVQDDWFSSLFDDPVLNDKMITDAAPMPHIQSEHSYSINDQIVDTNLDSVDIKMEDFNKDFGCDFFSTSGALDLSQKSYLMTHPAPPRQEIPELTFEHPAPTVPAATHKPHNPTKIIITATDDTYSYTKHAQTLIQKPYIKVEPLDTLDLAICQSGIDRELPPTPPGSSSSCDSDGSVSPQHSAPSSPVRHISQSSLSLSKPFVQPVFTNPIPTSGMLILTEEEKRTLVQEGYLIPNKLPLTKNEEKNLKKIRRKIKNKISAQESRRKKKEYLETLEKQVECFTQENTDLRRKVDNLEVNNRSLLGQLQKLQSLVSKYTGGNVSSNPTGSMLMVVVLCFAMFLGSWAPTSLNVGYNVGLSLGYEGVARPNPIHPGPFMGPSVKKVQVDSYSTPNMKSRMLLSLRDECSDDEGYGPRMPLLNPEMCDRSEETLEKAVPHIKPSAAVEKRSAAHRPKEARVFVSPEVAVENNQTRETTPLYASDETVPQALLHPDITVPTIRNVTVGEETA